MKLILLLSTFTFLVLSNSDCSKKKSATETYKGRLEIKGLCMNYTIRLIEGTIDTSKIAASWTDEMTKKDYRNVFALGSPCSFPDTIKEDDEFYFKLDSTTVQNCVVCMAYYPTPPKKLSIKVVDK